MLIGYFIERPYPDTETGSFGATGPDPTDLDASNSACNPRRPHRNPVLVSALA